MDEGGEAGRWEGGRTNQSARPGSSPKAEKAALASCVPPWHPSPTFYYSQNKIGF